MTTFPLALQAARPFVGRRELALYAGLAVASLPVFPFGWHLALHVSGAALLIGNALVMAVWLTLAGFLGSPAAKRRAASVVNRADAWFTVPGVFLLLANGLAMVSSRYGGFPAVLSVDWIVAGLVLLSGTGVVWVLRLLPTQLALHRLASDPAPLDEVRFGSLLIRWYVWGTIATIMPISAAALMNLKPNLW